MNIKEVAKRAKVSTATVSRTINDRGPVSEATAVRVREAIVALNYFPNHHARTLASGRSHMLGLIVSDISNPFFPELVKGFEDMAMQHGQGVIVTNTNYSAERMSLCVRSMLERKVDGVAIMTSEMDRKLIDELSRRGVPIVFLDVGTVKQRISNICVEYDHGICEAVEHLVGLGHRRIGFISGPLKLQSARIRRDAFIKYAKQFHLAKDASLLEDGKHKVDSGRLAMDRMLELRQPPTAVLASNDLSAIGALKAIHSRSLQVPADISLVGFDDIDLAQFTHPPLTTVRISLSELGRTAFHALHTFIVGDSEHGQEYRIGAHLIVRASTSVPKTR